MDELSRFGKVLDYLNQEKGLSNRTVYNELNKLAGFHTEDSTFNRYKKSSYQKSLDPIYINALHTLYNVNPNYLLGTSISMFDNAGIKLEEFTHLVKKWTTVSRNNYQRNRVDKYLHITMESSFYNFLLKTDHARCLGEENLLAFKELFDNYSKQYNDNTLHLYQEFVVVPRNVFKEIVTSETEKQLDFQEIIDAIDYSSYIDE